MTNLNQQILKFDYDQNFKDQDFYVSNSNKHSFSLLNSWPKWDKNFINLIGDKFSGKSHLINIFLAKINQINYENLKSTNENIQEYLAKTNINLIDDIYSSYDKSLNTKYEVKIFNNNIDRIKDYFK